jgi:hypothetical protein
MKYSTAWATLKRSEIPLRPGVPERCKQVEIQRVTFANFRIRRPRASVPNVEILDSKTEFGHRRHHGADTPTAAGAIAAAAMMFNRLGPALPWELD